MGSTIDTGVTGGSTNLLGNLATAARPLPDNVNWQAFGVSFVPENCGDAWVWQACTSTDDGDKPLNDGVAAVQFDPFLIEYNAQNCSGIPSDWDKLSDRAKRGISLRYSNALALALSSSTPDGQQNTNPNLPDTAVDVTPVGGPSSLVNTLAGLIQDAYDCGATGELFLHAPAWTLPYFLREQLLTQIGNVFKLGPHTVIFDQGYTNEGPTGVGSDPDVAPSPVAVPGQAYIYVSGPIEYATGSIQILDDTTKGVSPRLNRANVIAAQLAIYRFDPCCIFAALAKVC